MVNAPTPYLGDISLKILINIKDWNKGDRHSTHG